MSRRLVWILGAGGLLGSHLVQALNGFGSGFEVWEGSSEPTEWADQDRASRQILERCTRFGAATRGSSAPWSVAWCAGIGVVSSVEGALEAETAYFRTLLDGLARAVGDLPGAMLLASSAGGVYGGNPLLPLSERSECIPISAYGWNKLKQEALLAEWASGRANLSTLVARISNLYGMGQNVRKPQGLISHISRSLLHQRPVHIYVPLDTIRDYLFAPDCASHLALCLERLASEPGQRVVKVFAAEETVTVAALLGEFARIGKRHPRIICSPDRASLLQPVNLKFRSAVWLDLALPVRTPLQVGIQKMHQHHLSLFQRGELLMPPH